MEIIPNKYKLRCELGLCTNRAEHTIKFSRAGIRSRIHLCGDCLRALCGTGAQYLAGLDGAAADGAAETGEEKERQADVPPKKAEGGGHAGRRRR